MARGQTINEEKQRALPEIRNKDLTFKLILLGRNFFKLTGEKNGMSRQVCRLHIIHEEASAAEHQIRKDRTEPRRLVIYTLFTTHPPLFGKVCSAPLCVLGCSTSSHLPSRSPTYPNISSFKPPWHALSAFTPCQPFFVTTETKKKHYMSNINDRERCSRRLYLLHPFRFQCVFAVCVCWLRSLPMCVCWLRERNLAQLPRPRPQDARVMLLPPNPPSYLRVHLPSNTTSHVAQALEHNATRGLQ